MLYPQPAIEPLPRRTKVKLLAPVVPRDSETSAASAASGATAPSNTRNTAAALVTLPCGLVMRTVKEALSSLSAVVAIR